MCWRVLETRPASSSVGQYVGRASAKARASSEESLALVALCPRWRGAWRIPSAGSQPPARCETACTRPPHPCPPNASVRGSAVLPGTLLPTCKHSGLTAHGSRLSRAPRLPLKSSSLEATCHRQVMESVRPAKEAVPTTTPASRRCRLRLPSCDWSSSWKSSSINFARS